METIANKELDKYERVWAINDYEAHSPGKQWAKLFRRIADPQTGQTVLDVGCGKGDGSAILQDYGLVVSGLDIVDAYDQFDKKLASFHQQAVWRPIKEHYDYGYCCDVMEHIPEALTMLSAHNILQACDNAFFSISFSPDYFGSYIREPLHLTVQPFVWWRDMLREVGNVVDARDLIGEGIFYVSRFKSS